MKAEPRIGAMRRFAEIPLSPTGGEGRGEGAKPRGAACTLTRLRAATLSRNAGEGK
jgi:hypothetical protein